MSTEDAPRTRQEIKAEFAALFTFLETRFGATEVRLREYIDERTHDAETRLLRAVSDSQESQNVWFARLKADVGNIDASTDQRLTVIEDRLTNLDKRLIMKGI